MDSYASMVLGGEHRNVERLGLYVAWLINHQLFLPHVEEGAGRSMTRVRMQDQTGADFLSLELHGELKPEHLTDSGRRFTEKYLLGGQFDIDYDGVSFDGDNEWIRYAEVAPLITRAYRSAEKAESSVTGGLAKVLKFPAFGKKGSGKKAPNE